MTAAEQVEGRSPRWGLPDVFIGVVGSWVLSLVVFAVMVVLTGLEFGGETGTGSYLGRYGMGDALGVERTDPAPPLWTLPVGQLGLWAGMAGTVVVSATRRGNGLRSDFGWSMRASDVPIGLFVGVFVQVVVLWLMYAPFQLWFDFDLGEPARALTDRAVTPIDITLLMLGVVVGAPIVEELFFRGLALRAFERRWGPVRGVLASSVLFGAVHLQWLQFPGLVAFGIITALLVRRYGRLGPAIWAHISFNLMAVVSLIWLA